MKILLAYNGQWSATRVHKMPLPGDIKHFSTTHMSEVNHLLMAYWLEDCGHSVTYLVEKSLGGASQWCQHFCAASCQDIQEGDFDLLLIYKVHGIRLANKTGVLDLRPAKTVTLWSDAPGSAKNLQGVDDVNIFIWSSPEQLQADMRTDRMNTISEHATIFVKPPRLEETEAWGLYAGRLPAVYTSVVRAAGSIASMHAYALWVQDGKDNIYLRPQQIVGDAVQRAAKLLPEVELRPAVNMYQEEVELTKAAFGLCPAVVLNKQQLHSACKFYDYAALGLPSVLADNVPEARHVKQHPYLGELYTQGDDASLASAIQCCLQELHDAPEVYAERRRQVQQWAFTNATYELRARRLNAIFEN
jgi:hypothetical protein